MFMACKFSFCNILEKAKCGSLGRNHHHWSTIKNPLLRETLMNVYSKTPRFLLETPIFSSETTGFLLEIPIFSSEIPDFYWRPQAIDLIDSRCSNPKLFVAHPYLFIGDPKLLVFEPQFCFMGNT